jgi:hypothetical protein
MNKPGCNDVFPMTCPRLNARQLFFGCLLAIVTLAMLPPIWTAMEPFDPGSNYRTPFELSDDYWQYARLVKYAVDKDGILMIGDSVVWGEYTTPDDCLSSALNRMTGSTRFVNGGVNGLHPLAIEGMVHLNRRELHNTNVVLHCNLLWMSSPERDLSSQTPQSFNHSTLVSQFGGWPDPTKSSVPSYGETLSARIAIATTRNLPYRLLVEHVRRRYFGGQNVHQWSLQNPYEPIWKPVTFEMARPSTELRHTSQDWTKQGIKRQSFEWVDLDQSLQWQAFQRTVEFLRRRGNRVFVIVGPFNTHLMLPENETKFSKLRSGVTAWLTETQIPYAAPQVLPSQQYGDASHPLAEGYTTLARALLADKNITSEFEMTDSR